MGRLLCMVALIGLASLCSAQEAVYRNIGIPTSYFGPGASGTLPERGDEVTLAGTERTVTEITVYYITEITSPEGGETFKVRFYANDGGGGEPGTLLWQSADIPLKNFWRVHRVPVPNVNVPDTFTWTVQFAGMAGVAGDRAGLHFFGPPEIGSSADNFWHRTDG
ncbi:MAG: hypothetical protein IH851_11750, partial [Armatimonadetes bacterium]|nr:hypothetical protein [Armatimonadota bacterium]